MDKTDTREQINAIPDTFTEDTLHELLNFLKELTAVDIKHNKIRVSVPDLTGIASKA